MSDDHFSEGKVTRIIPEDLTESIVMVRKYAKNFRMSERTKLVYELIPPSLDNLKPPTKAKSDKSLVSFGSHKSSKDSDKFDGAFAKDEEGILSIEITDTGCGMTQREVEKIYEPFAQANREVQHKFGGTGLGLWLCQKLIAAMNGTITCKSQVNKGTTFTIELQVKHKELPKESTAISAFSRLNIICLSKNEKEIRSALRDMSCKIVARKDTKEIVETLRNFKLERISKYVILAGLKMACEIYDACKAELLGLKFSQIIIITSIGSPMCREA